MSIPGLDAWLASPQGRYVTEWELARIDELASDIFGFNALQVGLPQCDYLRASRIALRQRAGDGAPADVFCDLNALPFATHSIDLVVLPHVLEFHADPHQILREVERILIPEGRLLLTGFNPHSPFGLTRRLRRTGEFPWNGTYLSAPRLRDWLKLLGFEADRGTFGCFAPPCRQQKWLDRWRFIEGGGRRWWGYPGSVYLLQAIKRTPGMRLITPAWRSRPAAAKALRPVAQREGHEH